MNPARQTSSTPLETRCAWSAASNPCFPDKLRKSIAFAATPASRAAASPAASGLSDNNERDLGGEFRLASRLDQSAHVGSAARDEDGRSHPLDQRDSLPWVTTRASSRATSRPIRVGRQSGVRKRGAHFIFALGSDKDRHPKSAVEGAKHFVFRRCSRQPLARKKPEAARMRQDRARRQYPVPSTRGRLSV